LRIEIGKKDLSSFLGNAISNPYFLTSGFQSGGGESWSSNRVYWWSPPLLSRGLTRGILGRSLAKWTGIDKWTELIASYIDTACDDYIRFFL